MHVLITRYRRSRLLNYLVRAFCTYTLYISSTVRYCVEAVLFQLINYVQCLHQVFSRQESAIKCLETIPDAFFYWSVYTEWVFNSQQIRGAIKCKRTMDKAALMLPTATYQLLAIVFAAAKIHYNRISTFRGKEVKEEQVKEDCLFSNINKVTIMSENCCHYPLLCLVKEVFFYFHY